MALEFNSIDSLMSNLNRRGFQTLDRFYVVFTNIPQALNMAIRNNGFLRRDFTETVALRTSSASVPEQNIRTSTITNVNGVDYEHPYQYDLSNNVDLTILNDRFDRLRSIFADWLRLSSGISTIGAIPYRNQIAADLTIVSLDKEGNALSGYEMKDCICKNVQGTQYSQKNKDALLEFNITLSPSFMRKLNSFEASIVYASR